MSDMRSGYERILESRRSLYQDLLQKTRDYQKENPLIQPQFALMINEYILMMLQEEYESYTKDIIWLEKRIDDINHRHSFLTMIVSGLGSVHLSIFNSLL